MSCKSFAPSVALVALLAGLAGAQPEPWVHPDGTMHYYHAMSTPGGINWNAARDSALGRGGYLATLTSQAENDFVFGLVDSAVYWYHRPGSGLWAGPWLGGFQPSGSPEPDSGWLWIDNEPFAFLNWSPGEPDNQGNENALNFGESSSGRLPTWNDLSAADDSIRGFVRELSADSQTLGLFRNDTSTFVAYTLFTPLTSKFTYLIDNKGRLIHTWRSTYSPGLSVYLLEDGSLLHSARVGNTTFSAGGSGGRVERFDWDGNLLWSYQYSNTEHCQHHDAAPLPNGDVLLVAWEMKTQAEAIAAGRNPSLIGEGKLWPDHIVEVNPSTDSIVWEWHVWDHLIQDYDSTKANYGDPAQHSELVDLNLVKPGNPHGPADWLHVNSVAYNPEFDQIIISAHNFSEVWVIDHSTTTEQARGHTGGRQGMGGDLLYRWGNPSAYRAGDTSNQKFYGQHNAQWIQPGLSGAGHILVFSNGGRRGYSSVDEFIPACDSTGQYPRPAPGTPFGPSAQCWVYYATPRTAFFSQNISGAQRLPNGHTRICEGDDGTFFEVTHDSQVVWRYVNPATDSTRLYQGDTLPVGPGGKQNNTFRAPCYAPDYPGLVGKDLTPGYPLENYRSPSVGLAEHRAALPRARAALSAAPSPFRTRTAISLQLTANSPATLTIYNAAGRRVRSIAIRQSPVANRYSFSWDGKDASGRVVSRGVYYCRAHAPGLSLAVNLVKLD
jgi:hypothetical protein